MMIIRRAEEQDIDQVFLIEQQGDGDWKRDFFLNELSNSFSVFLVAEKEGRIAGFAVIWNVADEIQLNDIAVSPDFRRTGVGTELIQHIISMPFKIKPAKIFLEVREKNLRAVQFYKSLSFYETGRRKNYYGDDNAILMEKIL